MATLNAENSNQYGRTFPAGTVVRIALRGVLCYVTLARETAADAASVAVNLPGGIRRRIARSAVVSP